MRFSRTAAIALAVALTVAGCEERDPVADEADNTEATEIEALPPDESVEAPADEPANDAAEPQNGNAAQY